METEKDANMEKITIDVPGRNNIKLVLDPTDEATPAMVYAGNPGRFSRNGLGPFSSTYDCATGTGYVDDQIELTDAQLTFLNSKDIEAKIEAVFEAARPNS